MHIYVFPILNEFYGCHMDIISYGRVVFKVYHHRQTHKKRNNVFLDMSLFRVNNGSTFFKLLKSNKKGCIHQNMFHFILYLYIYIYILYPPEMHKVQNPSPPPRPRATPPRPSPPPHLIINPLLILPYSTILLLPYSIILPNSHLHHII
jgi:hypothetical protein